ncbi:MAG: alpha/beta hydrolase family protein [Flavipsychrobacter sp.]
MKQALSIAALVAITLSANAQSILPGNWEGKLDAGSMTLRMVLKVQEADGKYSGLLSSPDQGVSNIPIGPVQLKGDSVFFSAGPNANYEGKLNSEAMNGVWHQNGMTFPLDLAKTEKPSEVVRPQTPVPPFQYESEDVSFTNADKSITYGGTITIPRTPGAKPALLLITGSGAQNRDEELAGHKPFAVIADYLTNKGYIVLRVDDRGVGKTTGSRKTATSADYAKDANAAIDYLKSRKEVNPKKIGIMGHSEGGMIAPMVAASRNDIDFIILEAGPGVKIYELMEDQSAASLESEGMPAGIVADYRKLYRGFEQSLITGTSEADARNKMNEVMKAWLKVAKPGSIEIVGTTDSARAKFIDDFVEIYNDKWFTYFLKYDPQPTLEKLKCKVLAINGSRDIQVLPKSNLDGIRQSLAKSKSKKYDVIELEGLNHLFQECNKCTVAEYGTLDQTISPKALGTVSDWLDKNVK